MQYLPCPLFLTVQNTDMFEVTGRKHVSTAVTGDFRPEVWTVEALSRDNAQTLLLEAVFPKWSARGHLKAKSPTQIR
jgi:hypothetical protein